MMVKMQPFAASSLRTDSSSDNPEQSTKVMCARSTTTATPNRQASFITPARARQAAMPPFDMAVLNDLDRFHLVMDTIDRLPQTGAAGAALKGRLAAKLVEHRRYIREHGQDMPEIRNWRWKAAP